MDAAEKEGFARLGQLPLLVLYWRLAASGVTTIKTPSGEVTLNWTRQAREATMDALSEVVTDVQLRSLDPPRTRPLDLTELKPLSTADVEGKSVSRSPPLTESRTASEPSSAPTTATATA